MKPSYSWVPEKEVNIPKSSQNSSVLRITLLIGSLGVVRERDKGTERPESDGDILQHHIVPATTTFPREIMDRRMDRRFL